MATVVVTFLDRGLDGESVMSFDKTVGVALDVMGDDFIDLLIEKAKEIVKPYFKRDNEWVDKAKDVVKRLTKIKKGLK